jgi:hypothetical protein
VTDNNPPTPQHNPANPQIVDDTGAEDYKPTPRAITEHIGALKKSVGGGAGTPKGKGTPRPSATPKATPRKPATFKTPTSSAKRKHAINFSDDEEEDPMNGEDDSEAERKRLKMTPTAPRSSYSRRSKSVAKSYANDDDNADDDEEDADADAEEEHDHAAVRAPSSGLLNVQDDYFLGTAFDGAEETAYLGQRVSKMGVAAGATGDENDDLTPQGKIATRRVFKREIREDDSDISEFTPDF